MENHIARIERFGDVHIGTHAVLDNRQPPEGSGDACSLSTSVNLTAG